MLFNLLSNALKDHSPDRVPQVRLHVCPEADQVVPEVEDNGLGLDAASEQKLFSIFPRFHDHVEGSGTGLYMVKKMVENAGDIITLSTKLGLGTIFPVYFVQ